MFKAVVLWERAPDADWYSRHGELCKRVPGVTFRAGRIFGSPAGEPDRQQYAEFEFPDMDAFKAAADSEEFRATGKDAAEMGVPHSVYLTAVE